MKMSCFFHVFRRGYSRVGSALPASLRSRHRGRGGGADLGLVALPPSTFAARRVGPGTCLQGPGVEIEGGPDLPDILRGETRNNSYVHVPGMAVYAKSLLLRNTGESSRHHRRRRSPPGTSRDVIILVIRSTIPHLGITLPSTSGAPSAPLHVVPCTSEPSKSITSPCIFAR